MQGIDIFQRRHFLKPFAVTVVNLIGAVFRPEVYGVGPREYLFQGLVQMGLTVRRCQRLQHTTR